MAKKIDLMGFKSGKLTVIGALPRRNNRTYWKCRCECGNETDVVAYNIYKGRVKSCGLCGNGGKKLDLTGKRFGKLIALRVSDREKIRNETYWHCICDCGNETDVRLGHLTSGRTISCGCAVNKEPNEYRVDGNIVYVKMNGKNKQTMICDLDDWERLKDYRWNCACGGYATTTKRDELKYVEFHRLVTNPPEGMYVDHINRNILDNRKSNLRVVTPHLNNLNRGLSKANTTGYTGVGKKGKKWQASITINYKRICIGTYEKIEDAIEARKGAEEKYFAPLFDIGAE